MTYVEEDGVRKDGVEFGLAVKHGRRVCDGEKGKEGGGGGE